MAQRPLAEERVLLFESSPFPRLCRRLLRAGPGRGLAVYHRSRAVLRPDNRALLLLRRLFERPAGRRIADVCRPTARRSEEGRPLDALPEPTRTLLLQTASERRCQAPRGLVNSSNTCYLNSTLQLILRASTLSAGIGGAADAVCTVSSWTERVRSVLPTLRQIDPAARSSPIPPPSARNRAFEEAFAAFVAQYYAVNARKVVSRRRMEPFLQAFHTVAHPRLAHNVRGFPKCLAPDAPETEVACLHYQHDAGEALSTLLEDGLGACSWLSAVFGVIRAVAHTRPVCGNCRRPPTQTLVTDVSTTVHVPFLDAGQPRKRSANLSSLLAQDAAPNEYSDVPCPDCQHPTRGRAEAWSFVPGTLPAYLVIQLKRTTYTARQTLQRIQTAVRCPVRGWDPLDSLKDNALAKKFQDKRHGPAVTYDLVATVEQCGTATSGHYIAYTRDCRRQWYRCDDANIRKHRGYTETFDEANESSRGSSTIYLLLYERNRPEGG